MLNDEGLEKGRAWVSTPEEWLTSSERHMQARNERSMGRYNFEVVIGGLCRNGDFSFPYPGYYGTTAPVVALRRDQAAHLVVGLLRNLSPSGVLPKGGPDLLDLVAQVIREGSAT